MRSMNSRLPAMIPACGPPRSLSPLKLTTSTPASQLARATGSLIPLAAEIGEAAGAEVLVDGDVQAAAERGELVEGGPLGEAGDAEIRRVDAEEQASAFVEGAFVIADARAIGGADFAQHGAAFGHDVGNAEAVADFDQLAAGDDRPRHFSRAC